MPLARSGSSSEWVHVGSLPLPGGESWAPSVDSRTREIPEMDGNQSHSVPKGQPAGNTRGSCFVASRIWSTISPLEFAQKEEKRRTQQEMSGSRVVSSLGSLEPALAIPFQPNPKVTGAGWACLG